MSVQEESVAKLAKLESSMESMDEGQEEWLSEGILTDDDFNPAAENDSSAVQSQDEMMDQTTEEPTEQTEAPKEVVGENKQNGTELNTDKIEEALDNMENEKKDKNEEDLPGDLGTFLVRKTDGTIVETRERRDDTDMESPRHTDEDANDTDELLRMLGDDDQKAKKKKEVRKIVEKKKNDDQSSDEEQIFTGKVTRLKSKLMNKVPTKAVPEVTSDDESSKLKSRLRPPRKQILKKTPAKIKPAVRSDEESMTNKIKGPKKMAAKAVPELSDDDNVSSDDRNVMKKMFNVKKKVHFAAKSTAKASLTHSAQAQREKDASRRLESLKKAQKPKPAPMEVEPEEIIQGEEFLEDDAFEMDEYRKEMDAEIQSEAKSKRQRLMRPEQMDEEFLSDGDSASDDNSFYDDLPSTDTEEELEDWFTFDIRAERAGDYLPLLGDKAHQVLSEERSRLAGHVSSLRFDLAAAATAARAHATQLRRAAAAVAELDAAIKAAA